MADGGGGRPEREARGPRTADVIDGVAWDYDPERDRLSPLVSARRWFRDFPWEPKATLVDQPPAVRADPAQERPAAGPR